MSKNPFDLIKNAEKKIEYDPSKQRRRFVFGIRLRNFFWFIVLAVVVLMVYYSMLPK